MDLDIAATERTRGALPAVLILALTYAALAQGGFYWAQGSVLAVLLVAGAVVTPAGTFRGSRAAAFPFAALAAGLVVSAGVNRWPVEARQSFATLAIAAGALIVGRALIALGERRALLATMTTLGAGVACAGLVGLAFHHEPLALRAQGLWRTSSTLTYANSTSAFLTMALFAAIWIVRGGNDVAGERRRGDAVTRVALATISAGLMTTLSRGGILGATAGLVVIGLAAGRAAFCGTARGFIAGTIITLSLLPSIASDTGRPLIAFVGVVLSAAVVLAPTVRLSLVMKRALLAIGVVGLTVTAALTTQHSARLITARLSPGSEDRLRTWGNVWRGALEHPLLGSGPGTFRIVEVDGGEAILTRYAHNEYLQTFFETGIVGLLVIVLAGVSLARWLWRARPRVRADRFTWALAAGACTAFAVQSGFDFIWHMPLLVAMAFLWLAVGTEHDARRSIR